MFFLIFQILPIVTVGIAIAIYGGGGMLIPHTILWGQHAVTSTLCSMNVTQCGENMSSSYEHKALHDILTLQSEGGVRELQRMLPDSVSLCGDPERSIQQNRDGISFGLQILAPYNPMTMPATENTKSDVGIMINSKSSSPYALVYIHGGGFTLGSPKSSLGSVILFNEAIGHTGPTLACKYPLAPESIMSEIVAGAGACVDYMKKTYPDKKVILAGDSAGGSLVLMLHRQSMVAHGKAVGDGYLLISPAIDLKFKKTIDPLLTEDLWNIMYKHFVPALEPEGQKHWFPKYYSDTELSGLPHTWMWTGGVDPLVEDQIDFAKRFPSIKHFHNENHFHDAVLFHRWFPADVKEALDNAMPR